MVCVAIAVAIAILLVGVHHLDQASHDHASEQAGVLAATVAARVAALPPASRLDAMQLAARRTGSEYVLITRDGLVLLDATLRTPDRATLKKIARRAAGDTSTALGHTRYATTALDASPSAPVLVAFVRVPNTPEGGPALIKALIALTTLFVGVAATVAYAMAHDAARDVEFVTDRIKGMAHVHSEPTGEPVPVRALDEVGALTAAFNELVERFGAAELIYRQDLARVRAADRDRSGFLAAVSHELRSPLNAILGFADVLLSEVDGPLSSSAREEIEQIRDSGQHLLDLINDTLEFSALESGQLRLVRACVDLFEVAADVVRESGGLVAGRDVEVRIDGEQGVFVDADPRRVRQVITNVVSNAAKFTQRGEIVVSVSPYGAFGCVSVRDTGPGIDPAERAMIFEEYKQSVSERRRRRGTGLGLAIARRLVVMHGGSIHLESEVGRGSTFNVLIPRWDSNPDSREPSSHPPAVDRA